MGVKIVSMKATKLVKGTMETLRAMLVSHLLTGVPRPIILSHLITTRCNADCPFCLWKGEDEELTTEEVKALYRQAREIGILSVVVWGGEPLLRDDLPEVLESAHSAGLRTTVITNGYYLPEKFEEICPHLDMLTVSLDAVGEGHDAIRRLPGTFERATEGISLIRSRYRGVRILINTVITRLNIRHVDSLLEFSKKNDLPIFFEPMITWDYGLHPRTVEASSLVPSREEGLRVARELMRAKADGLPVVNSYEYLNVIGQRKASYRCWYKRLVLRVEANGRVVECLRRGEVIGDVKRGPLSDIVCGQAYRSFVDRTRGCSTCIDSATVESSFLWGLHPGSLVNAFRIYRYF